MFRSRLRLLPSTDLAPNPIARTIGSHINPIKQLLLLLDLQNNSEPLPQLETDPERLFVACR